MKVRAASRQPDDEDRLAPDAIREAAEQDEERRADQERHGDKQVGQLEIDFEGVLKKEEQCVELARVPDHALPGRRAEQRQQHDLEVAPVAEALREWRGECRPSAFISANSGDSLSLRRM